MAIKTRTLSDPKEGKFYPLTHTKAVVDGDGNSVDSLLAAEKERASNAEKNIASLVQNNTGKIKILGELIDGMKGKVVYLSQSEYDQLVQSGEIKEDVEYNIYEDEE